MPRYYLCGAALQTEAWQQPGKNFCPWSGCRKGPRKDQDQAAVPPHAPTALGSQPWLRPWTSPRAKLPHLRSPGVQAALGQGCATFPAASPENRAQLPNGSGGSSEIALARPAVSAAGGRSVGSGEEGGRVRAFLSPAWKQQDGKKEPF